MITWSQYNVLCQFSCEWTAYKKKVCLQFTYYKMRYDFKSCLCLAANVKLDHNETKSR